MEKLQAALEKARRTRGEQNSVPPRKPASQTEIKITSRSVDEKWAALPTLSLSQKQLDRRRLVTRDPNAKAAPFDILRTKVLLQMQKNGWKRIAITSPMPRSGKTTAACNLALGLGRQSDTRTMLFDLDLREPRVHEFLDVKPEISLAEVLQGRATIEEQAYRFGDNIAFSMAPEAERDPARVLLAESTPRVLDEIEEAYQPDVMIFDLPSALVNDDTRAFLKHVDCALIIVRANKTRYGQFDVTEREVAEQTNVLGVVLNAFSRGNTLAHTI